MWEFYIFYCGILYMPVLLLCPLSLYLLFHSSTQLQGEGFNHPTPPKLQVEPGAFLLQVWKGEFKLGEMNGMARCDHSCLLCLNSCCSPLRRSCHMVFLQLGKEWEENKPVWRGRVAEAAGRRGKEPQQGSGNCRAGCARVNATHLILQRETEARTLWARERIVQKPFCFVLFTLCQLESFVVKDSDPTVPRKRFL